MRKKQVLLRDVIAWLRTAMEAAQQDLGDAGGDYTALSYRELRTTFAVETGNVYVYVITRNREFAGYGEKTFYAVTHDGVEVEWRAEDEGIPTGADWLPQEFVEWMRRETPPVEKPKHRPKVR
jgi:hypothetical protein